MTDHEHTHSLGDVHGSVETVRKGGKWRRVAAFFGPAYLVSVGYMDPGNWATDLQGGSLYGYRLLWVLVMSNIIALLLQNLSARLGIVRGRDLAQCNREMYPVAVNIMLYILAEIAIAACDLAEVLGIAIGLNLLFHIPLLAGVLITLLDTVLILYLQRLGMRKLEAFIITLVLIIGGCFLIEMVFAKPDLHGIAVGLVPSIPDKAALYIAIGIIGATVMPHNLYLHSALVQTRKFGRDDRSIRKAIKLNKIDSGIALNLALFVNAAILILAAAVFYTSGHHQIAALKDAYLLLNQLLSRKWASLLFAVALIAAGQSSTITGTLAGQIVMEGYLQLRINPTVRRLLTRLLAIGPAVLVIWLAGDDSVDDMLVFSQVLLSMQLAFAVIPLIHFVSDREKMGKYKIRPIIQVAAWTVAAVIVGLNGSLLYSQARDVMLHVRNGWADAGMIAACLLMVSLLGFTFFYPLLRRKRTAMASIDIHKPLLRLETAPGKAFHTIAIALDYSSKDATVMQYALQLAQPDTTFILIHIVESASASRAGDQSEDYETGRDREQLTYYAALFAERNFRATPVLGFRNRASEIARIVREHNVDLLVVGSHGHRGFGDWLFGETIDSLRHMVRLPVFIAQ